MSVGGSKSESGSASQIDPRLYGEWEQLNQAAKQTASQPYQAYGGQLTAGDNDYLGAARDQAVGASYTGRPQVAQASKIFGEVADQSPNLISAHQLAGADLSPYANPYETQVVGNTLNDIDLQRRRSLNESNASAPSGAFGGSRQGVADSLTNESYGRLSADTASQLRQANFTQAQSAAGQDVDRLNNTDQFNIGADERNTALNLQGGQGLLGAGGQQQQQVINAQNALEQAGQQQQGTTQTGLDASYGQFLREIGDPTAKLNTLALPFGLQPTAQQSSSNSSGKSASAAAKQ